MPRTIRAGPALLDMFHRDAQVGARWLGLHPREFAVLWHLAERAGEPVSRRQLLRQVWRLEFDPATNRVAVAVCRIRACLRAVGVEGLIATVPARGYLLRVANEALDSPERLRDDAA
ncbi:winged helix-turn-helix domain-containing protein [Pelagerythrobacter marensis]|uniref:Winged helix-turn-helix domain-containing protein n=1 Tax=Pelagerythrobacter marensis TaxID=543877 RepID=A0ABZ2D606_9SPHN